MSWNSILFTGAVMLLSMTVSGAALAGGKGKQVLAPAAPATADLPACVLPAEDSPDLSCRCLSGFSRGAVWGSGPYTGDSDICTAAQHAGVIDAQGGALHVVRRPGQASYLPSSRNGIATSGWGAYHESFDVAGLGQPIASSSAASTTAPPLPACALPAEGMPSLTCQCPARDPSGSVWGSGPYTGDSDICTAAQHAGITGPDGGAIEVVRRPGQASYAGSSRNGVTTSSWGSYGESFDILPPASG